MRARANTLKIDKGVPLPPRNRRALDADTFAKMVVDDSVFFKVEKEAANFYRNLTYYNTNRTFGAAMRKVDGGWRVWLTPKKLRGKV